jgi:regulatory protein
VPAEQERLQHALGLAYRYLNSRERTTTEVLRHLELNGIDAACRQRALELLTEEGTIDDARFARLFVQDKRELAEWGRERIRQGLLARGIDSELAQDTLDAGSEPRWDGTPQATPDPHQAELERALALLRRRFPAPPRERRDRDRALGLLIRKGYDPDLALDALAAYARGGRARYGLP